MSLGLRVEGSKCRDQGILDFDLGFRAWGLPG